jgi:hypothetical protein
MNIGITGHQRLADPSGWDWTATEIDNVLASVQSRLTGISSLAIGADQLFAEAVLRRDGRLEVIVPFEGYELGFAEGAERANYERLLASAARVEVLRKDGSAEEAYFAAGKRVVELADVLLAVWDGKPAAGLGGTGDVVNYAMNRGKRVVHVNPVTRLVIELGGDRR